MSSQTLWKPVSEQNGNAVVLVSNAYGSSPSVVRVLGADGRVLEDHDATGKFSNGNRADFRLSRPGSSYGEGVTVEVEFDNGSIAHYPVGSGGSRSEFNDDTSGQFIVQGQAPSVRDSEAEQLRDIGQSGGFIAEDGETPVSSSIAGSNASGNFNVDGIPDGLQFVTTFDDNGNAIPRVLPTAAIDPNQIPSLSIDEAFNQANRSIEQNFANQERSFDQAGGFADEVVETNLRGQRTQIEENAPLIREQQQIDQDINIERGNQLDERNRTQTGLANADTRRDTGLSNAQLITDTQNAVNSTGFDFVENVNRQLDRADRLAQGDFSDIIDGQQFEREFANAGADIASASGVGAASTSGTDIGKKFSALERLNIAERGRAEFTNVLFGAQQQTQSQPQASQVQLPRVTDVPLAESRVGSDIQLEPISAGEAQVNLFSQTLPNSQINPNQVFQESRLFQTNEQARVEGILGFEQSLRGAQESAVQGALDNQEVINQQNIQRQSLDNLLDVNRQQGVVNAILTGGQFLLQQTGLDETIGDFIREQLGQGQSLDQTLAGVGEVFGQDAVGGVQQALNVINQQLDSSSSTGGSTLTSSGVQNASGSTISTPPIIPVSDDGGVATFNSTPVLTSDEVFADGFVTESEALDIGAINDADSSSQFDLDSEKKTVT